MRREGRREEIPNISPTQEASALAAILKWPLGSCPFNFNESEVQTVLSSSVL